MIRAFVLFAILTALGEGYIYMPFTHTERKLTLPLKDPELIKTYENYIAFMVRKQNQDLRDAHKKLKSGICMFAPVHCQVGDTRYYKVGEDDILRLGRTSLAKYL
uniref:Pepsin-I3 domain-containing protein n=1 Tax=Rhabditophanes sp. KR3021 TaxID=114890 RepID=A0AC35TKZ3_9BILA